MDMTMTSGIDDAGLKMQKRTLQYLKTKKNGRFLLTIHTHTDAANGLLCNSEGPNGIAYVSTISDVCSYNLGEDVMHALALRDALSGLLLLTCAAMRSNRYAEAEALVSK